jgi:hypothetical protein
MIKNCLNSAAMQVLKIKSICAECSVKINVYSFQEMADMHLIYGHANGDSKEARHLYQQRFPHEQLPSRHSEHLL